MRTLVIDTATRACSVALIDGDEVLAESHEVIGRGHAEHLLPLIAALPDKGKAERIAVNVGPGSFTGIRIGISAARALTLAWKAECTGYGCLDMVAAMARAETPDPASVSVVMTGGHGEYFCQSFAADGTARLLPLSLDYESARKSIVGDIFAGDAIATFAEHVAGKKMVETLPRASAWSLAINQLPASALYVRPPDAKTKAELGL